MTDFRNTHTQKKRIPPLLISFAVLLAVFLAVVFFPQFFSGGDPSALPDSELDALTDPAIPLAAHFPDVGQGAAALFVSDGHAVVVDGGGRERSSFFVAYLKEHGVTEIDALVATHFDEDHIAGLIGAMNVFPVREVLVPDYAAGTKIYASFMKMAQDKSLPVRTPSAGETVRFGAAALRIAGPARFDHEKENDNSLIVLLSGGGCRFLITGDAEAEGEAELLASGRPIAADVLAVGHHGSASSTGSALLKAVKPRFAVISVGAGNDYGHPASSVLSRLTRAGCTVLRTDESGTILLTAQNKTILPG